MRISSKMSILIVLKLDLLTETKWTMLNSLSQPYPSMYECKSIVIYNNYNYACTVFNTTSPAVLYADHCIRARLAMIGPDTTVHVLEYMSSWHSMMP